MKKFVDFATTQNVLLVCVFVNLRMIKIVAVGSRLIQLIIIYAGSSRMFLIGSCYVQMIFPTVKYVQVVLVRLSQI
jgi:hypothetical protein